MAQQKFELNTVTDSEKFWGQGSYTQESESTTLVQYNGKRLNSKSAPNRLLQFQEQSKLGEGSFGSVFKAQAYTIDYQLKEVIYKKEKVVKIILNVDAQKKKDIKAEYAQGKKTPQLGMKKPVFSGQEGNETCYMVMNRLPGKELFELIKNDTISNLPVRNKLLLTYRLLLALRDQVTRCGIVHRDIKPQNIMVETSPIIRVNIIDYGLAKTLGKNDRNFPGTPSYAAPELFAWKPHGELSDVFPMGKVIALFWINDPSNSILNTENNPYLLNPEPVIKDKQTDELKRNPAILELLTRMVATNPKDRISIDQAITLFENHYPKLKIIQSIHHHLSHLKNYAAKIESTHAKDFETLSGFIKEMEPLIADENNSFQDIKKACLEKLAKPEITHCAKNHEYCAYVCKNILAAVLGLVVFYGIACGINKLATGRATFFHNEISHNHYQITKALASAPSA